MKSIKIIETGSYIPSAKVENCELEEKLKLENGYIIKRTGIKTRYYAKEETIEEMAKKAVDNLLDKINIRNTIETNNNKLYNQNELEIKTNRIIQEIGLIITATTSPNNIMPGISNEIQNKLHIEKCICLDVLAGCSGYINAIDIAQMYITTERVKKALIIGVDKLSEYTDENDIGTSIILSDGAGAILMEQTEEHKKYKANIEAEIDKNKILTCSTKKNIQMKGKDVYKYAVTKPLENMKKLLEETDEDIENIKYIIPHQSNMKIMKAIISRAKVNPSKIYTNIENIGNTFCASIPIALNEMKEKNMLQEKDKVILLGYGGGLNTGSILLEI